MKGRRQLFLCSQLLFLTYLLCLLVGGYMKLKVYHPPPISSEKPVSLRDGNFRGDVCVVLDLSLHLPAGDAGAECGGRHGGIPEEGGGSPFS